MYQNSRYLGTPLLLKNYNGLNVPVDYFNEAMERLCARFLNVTLDSVLHPVSNTVQQAVQKQQVAASKADEVRPKELTAQEWLEQGIKQDGLKNYTEAIHCYTEALQYKPDYAEAYNNRGVARYSQGDFEGALVDYTEAIHLKLEEAYVFNNRGCAYYGKGDLEAALKDWTEAIRINPGHLIVYKNRAQIWEQKGEDTAALADYQKYLELGGGKRNGDQAEIEAVIHDLKQKIK